MLFYSYRVLRIVYRVRNEEDRKLLAYKKYGRIAYILIADSVQRRAYSKEKEKVGTYYTHSANFIKTI
jgi:hypothetical protein